MQAERFPDQPAILFGERRISYAELDDLASRFGAGLLRLGIRRGDRIGLYMTNHPEWVIAFFGIARMGGVIVPMNTRYRSQEVAYILNNCGATGLVMGARYAKSNYVEIVESVWDEIPTLRQVIVHGEGKRDRMLRFQDALHAGDDYAGDPEGDPQVAIDPHGAAMHQRVIISFDGSAARKTVGDAKSPARCMIIGIVDENR